MTQAKQIVDAARTWVGVRFHHQGRSRAAGIDCLGLLVKVAEDCALEKEGQLLSDYDAIDYGRNPDVYALRAALEALLSPIALVDMMEGDVVLLTIEGRPQHLAILSDYPAEDTLGMIHAYAPAHKVVEHRFDETWQGQVAGAYRFV